MPDLDIDTLKQRLAKAKRITAHLEATAIRCGWNPAVPEQHVCFSLAETDAILAALERATELERENARLVGEYDENIRMAQRAERLEAAARAILPYIPVDDPTRYGKVAAVTAAMDLRAALADAPATEEG